MEGYVKGLQRPNQNTDGAHREFRKNLNLLEEEQFLLLEKYLTMLEHGSFVGPFEQLQIDLEQLSGHIDNLTLSCTLSTQLPDFQSAALKSLDCPNL